MLQRARWGRTLYHRARRKGRPKKAMVFIQSDGKAAPEMVQDKCRRGAGPQDGPRRAPGPGAARRAPRRRGRYGRPVPKEEPLAQALGIKQKQIWEPGWRVRDEEARVAGLGITEETVRSDWWAQRRLEAQGVAMPRAPAAHLERLKTKGIDMFAEPRGSKYSLGEAPPYARGRAERPPSALVRLPEALRLRLRVAP